MNRAKVAILEQYLLQFSLFTLTGLACSWQLPGFTQVASTTMIAQSPPTDAPRPDLELLEPDRPNLQPLPETLPPALPPLLSPDVPSPDAQPPEVEARVEVRQVVVLGNTVFSVADIEQVTAPFIGRSLTFEELLEIRTAITNLYIQRGYTTSGAFLPPQDVSDGIVEIQAVEGELERVEIQGLTRLRQEYVRDRIQLAAKPPINLQRLETALQLLQLDPLLTSVNAELQAGTSPGRSVLKLTLRETAPFSAALTLENRDSPSVGSVRESGTVSYTNLLGLGDRVTTEIGFTRGVDSYDFGYSLPLNARDGTLTLRYIDTNSEIVEEPFSVLDITGKSRSFTIGFRQPIHRTPASELALGLSLDFRRSETLLLDEPFSFAPGTEDGESKVTVLRFSQDWIQRSPRQVLAARSQFSLGLDAFGATVNDTGTDGRFFSWVGQFQWVQSLGNGVVSIARVATQLTGDSLLPLEQFSIGGIDTIRGYRQNQRVADNGIIGSLEVRFPIVQDDRLGTIQLAPFFDIGTVWNNNDVSLSSPKTLASLGLGLRWQVTPYFSARLDWGIPLTNVDDQGDSLQDNGIVFSIRLQPF